MTVYENITLKPKPSSSTNKFQKNNTENSIAINNEDSKQTIKKTWYSSLYQMDFMIKNMHKSWSLID
jgi:hypothetical protein